jgi:hypothetical protein
MDVRRESVRFGRNPWMWLIQRMIIRISQTMDANFDGREDIESFHRQNSQPTWPMVYQWDCTCSNPGMWFCNVRKGSQVIKDTLRNIEWRLDIEWHDRWCKAFASIHNGQLENLYGSPQIMLFLSLWKSFDLCPDCSKYLVWSEILRCWKRKSTDLHNWKMERSAWRRPRRGCKINLNDWNEWRDEISVGWIHLKTFWSRW